MTGGGSVGSQDHGSAYGNGLFLQGNETVALDPASGQTTTISGVIADETGSRDLSQQKGAGSLLLDGAGTVVLSAANTFTGGVTLKSGTLEVGAAGTPGSGAITFAGPAAELKLDATPANGATFATTINGLAQGDALDLAGLRFVAGAKAAVSGNTLTVTSGATTERFLLTNVSGSTFSVENDGAGGAVVDDAGMPAILGVNTDIQKVTGTVPVKPFSTVTISDPNLGATDTLTITVGNNGRSGGPGGTLSGAGLAGTGPYTLTGTAAAITAQLDALSFTPNPGVPGTSLFSTFTLSDLSSAFATPYVNDLASLVVNYPNVAPTITGVVATAQPTISEAAVTPFSTVTISDANLGAKDTLTITIGGAGGTLSGAGLSGTGPYTLSGTAAAITTALDALSFRPTAGAPGTSSTSTFTLSDVSSAFATPVVNSQASVVDTDPAQSPTITVPTADQAQTSTGLVTVAPFKGVAITDPNAGSPISDTNSAGQTATSNMASVTVNLPALTTAQLQQVGKDFLQFYTDTVLHKSTAADTSKLGGDFTSLDISQAELGQLLGQTLASAMLASPAAATLGTDIAATFYPKITADLAAGNNTGLAADLTGMLATTAGAGADDLLRVHSGQSATAALTATVQDFKLA